jgi:hypothetical protein
MRVTKMKKNRWKNDTGHCFNARRLCFLRIDRGCHSCFHFEWREKSIKKYKVIY